MGIVLEVLLCMLCGSALVNGFLLVGVLFELERYLREKRYALRREERKEKR